MGLVTLELTTAQAIIVKDCLEKQTFLLQKHIQSICEMNLPEEVKLFNKWKLDQMTEVQLNMILTYPIGVTESRLGEQFVLFLDATQKKSDPNENH